MTTRFTCRRATAGDAGAVAAVFSPSFRLLTFLPIPHTVEQDRGFIADVILKECEVTVAEHAGRIASFLARDGKEIRLLDTHPDLIGVGAGRLLLDGAKAAATALELWCSQANTGARRFYAWHGFRPIRFIDGRDNEEKTLDVHYRWQR